MRGTIASDGTMTITFNVQAEHLEAPPTRDARRKYQPCEECGALQIVPLDVVALSCSPCNVDMEDAEREEDLVYQGRKLCGIEEGSCGEPSFADHCAQLDANPHRFALTRKRWLRRGLQDARGL